MDPEQVMAMVRALPRRVVTAPLGRWQILMCLPFAGFFAGVSFRSIELLLISAPLIAFVVSYYAMRLILLNGGELFVAAFTGFAGFVVVAIVSLAWMFGDSRPWMDAGRRAQQDGLLQLCIDQRLAAECDTPDCKASSYEETRSVCLNEWLSGCYALTDPRTDREALLDTLCTYFRTH